MPSSHQPPLTVKIGAAGKTSGMSGRRREADAIRSAAATSSAMRRAEVTPHRSIVFKSSFVSAWTWASISPGTIHLPAALMTRVPAGSARSASGVAAPIETILPAEMTTREFARGGFPAPSTSVAPWMAKDVASKSSFTTKREEPASML